MVLLQEMAPMKRKRFVGPATIVPASLCPYCGNVVDGATAINHYDKPTPGNPSVCIWCIEVCVLDDQLRLRRPTVQELIDLQTSTVWPTIEEVRKAIRMVKKHV
jgi:hypothetical protein